MHLLSVPNTSSAERCAYARRPQRLFYALHSSGRKFITQQRDTGQYQRAASGDCGHIGGEEEEEEGLFIANAVNEEESEHDRATKGEVASLLPQELSRTGGSAIGEETKQQAGSRLTTRRTTKVVSWRDLDKLTSLPTKSPPLPAEPAATPPLGSARRGGGKRWGGGEVDSILGGREEDEATPRRIEPSQSYAPMAIPVNMYSLTAEEDAEIERLLAGGDPRLSVYETVDEGTSGEGRSRTRAGSNAVGSQGIARATDGEMSLCSDNSDPEGELLHPSLSLLHFDQSYEGSELEVPPGPIAP